MKWLFWLLLLASMVFFALIQWGGVLLGDGKNQQPQPPLNAEKIRLLRTPPAPPVAPPVVPPPAPSPAPPLAEPLVPPSPAQSAVQATAVCMEWGGFSGHDLTRATAALDALKLGDKLSQRQVEHASGYWVYIPPLKTRAEADKKVAQLKARGVEEYFIVQEAGKWRNAISLGVFRTEDAAQKYLESLRSKGVKSALAGERMSKFMLTVFVLKNPDAAVTAKMAELQNEFAGSELKAAACDN
ncbi:MAG: SPOR domain-containing protein [Betaproteobacteria bacterium]|nr:SPOR domain-containing protein [Betaproteobacteria bacterium]